MQVNFNVLNQEGAPALFESPIRPQPGFLGRLYFSTNYDDSLAPKGIWADDGHNWQQIATNGGGGIPTLQQVTEAGNSTNQKIELTNNNPTVDAIAISLNESNQGINIFGNDSSSNINYGLIIDFIGGEDSQSNCGIYSNVMFGTAIYGNNENGIAGYFNSVNGAAAYLRSNNFFPLVIDSAGQAGGESISFVNQVTYTGAAVPAAEYLPINIDGTTHLIRLFSAV